MLSVLLPWKKLGDTYVREAFLSFGGVHAADCYRYTVPWFRSEEVEQWYGGFRVGIGWNMVHTYDGYSKRKTAKSLDAACRQQGWYLL